MPQNNQDKFAYGIHSVISILENNPETAIQLFIVNTKNKNLTKIQELAKQYNIPIQNIAKPKLDKLINQNHQGIALEIKNNLLQDPPQIELMDFIENLDHPAFLLILDSIQDPHNLGACLRSAYGAGVDAVIVPKDKAVNLTPVVRKVASGAAENIPFYTVTNLARTMEELKQKGIWLYGAAGEAEQAIYKLKLTGPIGIVLGSEGKGMRRLTREHCDELFKIPMANPLESLNVSVATGISLFEALRQRNA